MKLAGIVLLFGFSLAGQTNSRALEERVRDRTLHWLDALPNFVAEESHRELTSYNNGHSWEDSAQTRWEIHVERGIERYLRLDPAAAAPSTPRLTDQQMIGSQGEFFSAIRVLFEPQSGAKFWKGRVRQWQSRTVRTIEFNIPQKNSQWWIGGREKVNPAYWGWLYVDEQTGVIWRLRMFTNVLEYDSLLKFASLVIDFSPKPVSGETFLLPDHSEILVCRYMGYCEKKLIEFGPYRRFDVTSQILPSQ